MNEEQKVPPYGQVNTLNGDKSVWLVKVPPVIFDEWMKAPPRATLGRIEVETIPGSSDVKMTCHANVSTKLPAVFKLDGQPQGLPTFIISDNGKEQDMRLEGRVAHKLDMIPEDPAAYARLVRQLGESRKEQKSVQLLTDEDEMRFNLVSTNIMRGQVTQREPRDRRERMEKPQLLNLIFNLFKKKENWTLKEMNEVLQQPEGYLREVLGEVCEYVTSGKVKSTYQLKPEYREGGKKDAMQIVKPEEEQGTM